MSKLSAGRKPLSSKSRPTQYINEAEVFGNTFSLDPGLVSELNQKGLAYRFASAKAMIANQGYHPRGWVVYKRDGSKTDDTMGVRSALFGNDPDGVVRRGDSILVVKSKEASQKHKMLLEQKASRLKSAAGKRHAEELRETAREHGLRTQVSEGYEDDRSSDGDED